MSDTVQCWLVDRVYDDKGLITLTYASPDGSRRHVIERAAQTVGDVTAATEVESDRLDAVQNETTRERYASEAERMEARHDPEESV